MIDIFVTRHDDAGELFKGNTATDLSPGWYAAVLRLNGQPPRWMASIRFAPQEGGTASPPVILAEPFTWRLLDTKIAVFFLVHAARNCTIQLTGVAESPDAFRLALAPLPQLPAFLGLWLQSPRAFGAAYRETSGGIMARLRRTVELTATQGQHVPQDYTTWHCFHDRWPRRLLRQIETGLHHRPQIAALIFTTPRTTAERDTLALAATLASLRNQVYPPAAIATRSPQQSSETPLPETGYEWIALIQAGEIIPRQALLLFAAALQHPEPPDILYADEDTLTRGGTRTEPVFKPQPSLTFMCSGLLSRGIWLIRKHLLDPGATQAECARLQGWFTMRAAGRAQTARRLPFILTHARHDIERALPQDLAQVVNAGLAQERIEATVAPAFPLRLHWQAGATNARKVSVLIPSRLKGETQRACIDSLIHTTIFEKIEFLIVVTQQAPLDEEQEANSRRLTQDPRVTVRRLPLPAFNYSAANNFAARHTGGDFICLVNDDVSPLQPDWLARMVAILSDPAAAVVGAKLYYPDMTTQHGGVVMGFGGLAQHLNRFLPRGQPGYTWRAMLDQELSCVTGACLLVRRQVFDSVGGLDEALPTAFNDVDFCLKVRRAGHGVVFAASVEMVHHETLTFGHHYSANRSQEYVDGAEIVRRWREVCDDDPFYNPNLQLLDRHEWQVAFPPRTPYASPPEPPKPEPPKPEPPKPEPRHSTHQEP